jgi:hypothetical protein
MHEIAYQKVEKLPFSLKVWWDAAHQIWWVAFVRFDEMTFSLIKFDESLSSFDEVTFSFIKFDEPLSSSLMRCLIIDAARQIENRHTSLDNREWACVTRQKWTRRPEKNWRWDDQAWSREWIVSESLQRTNLNRIPQITFHTPRQNAKHVISIPSQQLVSVLTASKSSFEKAH